MDSWQTRFEMRWGRPNLDPSTKNSLTINTNFPPPHHYSLASTPREKPSAPNALERARRNPTFNNSILFSWIQSLGRVSRGPGTRTVVSHNRQVSRTGSDRQKKSPLPPQKFFFSSKSPHPGFFSFSYPRTRTVFPHSDPGFLWKDFACGWGGFFIC